MTLLAFYKTVLASIRHDVDDDGLISREIPGSDNRPASVNGKRLVLPTDAQLRAGFGDDVQPFHPLSENIARRGASEVQNYLQRNAKAQVTFYLERIAERLLAVAADPALHKDLPPSCSEYLTKVPKADKKSLKTFDDLMESSIAKKKVTTLYLKNGGSYQGQKYNRLCVVRFPLIEQLEEDETKVNGVTLRKRDLETFSALLRYIVPFGDDPEEYSAGSNSKVAPFFDAFLRAYAKIAGRLNHMVKRYGKTLDLQLKPIPLDFVDDLDDLGEYYGDIPPLRGNEGQLSKEEAEREKQEVQAVNTGGPGVAPTPSPAPAARDTKTASTTSGDKLSFEDFLSGGQQAPQQSPGGMSGYMQARNSPYSSATYGVGYPQAGGYPGQGGYGGPQQGGYPGQPGGLPAWLTGGQTQQPVANTNPFAAAVAPQRPQAPTPYGNAPGGNTGGPSAPPWNGADSVL